MAHTDDTTSVAAIAACETKHVHVAASAAAGTTIADALGALDELSGAVAAGKVVEVSGSLHVCIKDA